MSYRITVYFADDLTAEDRRNKVYGAAFMAVPNIESAMAWTRILKDKGLNHSLEKIDQVQLISTWERP